MLIINKNVILFCFKHGTSFLVVIECVRDAVAIVYMCITRALPGSNFISAHLIQKITRVSDVIVRLSVNKKSVRISSMRGC